MLISRFIKSYFEAFNNTAVQEPPTKPCIKLLLHQFCLTLLSKRGESNKTNAKEVSYEASYEAPLTRKTRL